MTLTGIEMRHFNNAQSGKHPRHRRRIGRLGKIGRRATAIEDETADGDVP